MGFLGFVVRFAISVAVGCVTAFIYLCAISGNSKIKDMGGEVIEILFKHVWVYGTCIVFIASLFIKAGS